MMATNKIMLTIRSSEDLNGNFITEGISNAASVTDSYGTRMRFTDACITASRGHVVLFNHNPDMIVGRNLEMTRTRDGSLAVRDRVNPDAIAPNGVRFVDLIRAGDLTEYSIRFDADAKLERGQEFDLITPNRLDEHSYVSMPSNTGSIITAHTRGILEQLERDPEGQAVARAFRLSVPAWKEDTVPDTRVIEVIATDALLLNPLTAMPDQTQADAAGNLDVMGHTLAAINLAGVMPDNAQLLVHLDGIQAGLSALMVDAVEEDDDAPGNPPRSVADTLEFARTILIHPTTDIRALFQSTFAPSSLE